MIVDTLVYTVLPRLSFVASLFILPFISPYLTLEDYGIYGQLISYIALFQIFIGLGQVVVMQNSFFTHKENYKLVWRRSFAIMCFAGLLSSIVLAFILKVTVFKNSDDNFLPTIAATTIYLILNPLDSVVVNYYTLKEKSLPYAYGMAFVGVVTTVSMLITIKYLKMGYMGWIISLPLNAVFTNIVFFKKIYLKEKLYPQFNVGKKFLIKALRVGLPLTPHQLSLYVLGLSDRILLSYFNVSVKQIGFYSQGYNLGSQGGVVVNGVFQAFSKRIQEAFRGTEKVHRGFIRKAIIRLPVTISLILFLAGIWSKEGFSFLFRNPSLQEAYPITILVLSSYMFWSIYSFFTYPLSIKGQTFSISKITLLAAAFNLVGNFVFIPHYGIWGALVVTYLSYMIFGFAGLLNKENRTYLNRYINVFPLSALLLVINVMLFVIAYSIKDEGVIVKIGLTVFILCFSLFIFKKQNSNVPSVF